MYKKLPKKMIILNYSLTYNYSYHCRISQGDKNA